MESGIVTEYSTRLRTNLLLGIVAISLGPAMVIVFDRITYFEKEKHNGSPVQHSTAWPRETLLFWGAYLAIFRCPSRRILGVLDSIRSASCFLSTRLDLPGGGGTKVRPLRFSIDSYRSETIVMSIGAHWSSPLSVRVNLERSGSLSSSALVLAFYMRSRHFLAVDIKMKLPPSGGILNSTAQGRLLVLVVRSRAQVGHFRSLRGSILLAMGMPRATSLFPIQHWTVQSRVDRNASRRSGCVFRHLQVRYLQGLVLNVLVPHHLDLQGPTFLDVGNPKSKVELLTGQYSPGINYSV